MPGDPMMQLGPAQGMGPDQPKASPLAKRLARPPQGPPAPKVGLKEVLIDVSFKCFLRTSK